MDNYKQLISTNSGFFRQATIAVSTVKLPADFGYETAVISFGNIEVVEKYGNSISATEGHMKWSRQFGVN